MKRLLLAASLLYSPAVLAQQTGYQILGGVVQYGNVFKPTPAARVGDFLNIIGVNTHFSTYQTPLYSGALTTVLPTLQYIGANFIRDGFASTAVNGTVVAQYIYLSGNGIGVILCTPFPSSESGYTLTTSQTITDTLNVINSARPDIGSAVGSPSGPLFVIEEPNEPNGNNYTFNSVASSTSGTPGFSPVSAYAAALYSAVRDNAFTAQIPILATSNGGFSYTDAGLQWLSIPYNYTNASQGAQTTMADIYNSHTYPMYGASIGTSAASVDPALGGSFGGDFFKQSLSDNYASPVGCCSHSSGATGPAMASVLSSPHWVSEFGYATAGNTTNGFSVSTHVQAAQILNGLLNAWQDGVGRVAIYELYDDVSSPSASASFGLYSFTGTAKPSATWLHNFITILADPTTVRNSFSASSLNFGISGLPANAQYELFQASSGEFYIVVWPHINDWNVAAGTQITISPTTVTLSTQNSQTLKVYDPSISTTAQTTTTGFGTTFSMTDYPIIITVQ